MMTLAGEQFPEVLVFEIVIEKKMAKHQLSSTKM